jgi:shikimate dehydrogenase
MPVVDLLVNTSSLGMAGQPPAPAAEAYVAKGGTVFDIVTTRSIPRCCNARARDLRTLTGLPC